MCVNFKIYLHAVKRKRKVVFDFYLRELGYPDIPEFLKKYLEVPILKRLKNVSYFCGMNFASKEIYNMSENVSRYAHSLSVALIVYRFTHDKSATLAGLFHDVSTPCFSHAIDFMNGDAVKQESTEEYTERILRSDETLLKYLKEDSVDIEDLINFKKFTIVDNVRPKLCADRIDGVVLPGIGLTKNLSKDNIRSMLEDLCVYKNEYGEDELGFKTESVAQMVLDVSDSVDNLFHTNKDNFMMSLLAKIARTSIDDGIITYDDLFILDESELFDILKKSGNSKVISLINKFETVTLVEIPKLENIVIKHKELNPLVKGKRLKG